MNDNKIPADVRVMVDPETMKTTAGHSVTGLLCFRFGDTFFPDEKSRDFPVCVLDAWLKTLLAILLEVDTTVMFRFFDDPPVLWGRVLTGGRIALQGLYSERARRRTACFAVRITDLTQAFLTAADQVVQVARRHDWEPRVTESLAEVTKRIREQRDPAICDGTPSSTVPGELPYDAGCELPPVPPPAELRIDMEHITSCHGNTGSEITPRKTLFPTHMSQRQIEDVLREAYGEGYKTWPDASHLHVWGMAAGLDVEMWVDPISKTIETAYPLYYDDDEEDDTDRC